MNTKKSNVSMVLAVLGVLFTSALVVANILANKQLALWQWSVPAGVLCFPISYIISDVVSEVYGYRASRLLAWLGLIVNIWMSMTIKLAITIPAPVWFEGAEAFKVTLNNTGRIVVAGYTAYILGSWGNSWVMSVMKRGMVKKFGTENSMKGFGWRAIASTALGEFIDSSIFITLAFLGTLPVQQLPGMIIAQTLVKTGYEIIVLPLTYKVVKKVKNYEEHESFDEDVAYGIFGGK